VPVALCQHGTTSRKVKDSDLSGQSCFKLVLRSTQNWTQNWNRTEWMDRVSVYAF